MHVYQLLIHLKRISTFINSLLLKKIYFINSYLQQQNLIHKRYISINAYNPRGYIAYKLYHQEQQHLKHFLQKQQLQTILEQPNKNNKECTKVYSH